MYNSVTLSNQGGGGGLLQPHLRFFLDRSKTLKEVTKGIIGNLFYILCGHFHEKKWGTTLPGGRVSRQSQRVRGWMQPFQF